MESKIRFPKAAVLWATAGIILLALPAAAGTILKASCPCGFKMEGIFAGGGMSNFKTFCAAPAYCEGCKKMEVLNWLDDAPVCHACAGKVIFYNDPALQEKTPAGSKPNLVFSWNTDKKGAFNLPDVNYRCPQCGKMTLRFEMTGNWD